MHRIVFALLLVCSAGALARTAGTYFTPQFTRGERYTDIYSKSVAVTGQGFDPVVRRFSGRSAYVVTSAAPRALTFDETDVADGRPGATSGQLEIRDKGNTNCYNGSCALNTQTSGLVFIPPLWGAPPEHIEKQQRWTVDIPQAWEIGPAGHETVTVVSVDPADHVVILQRDGRGDGPSEDDRRGLSITADGKTAHATVEAGPSHWSGQIVIRAGVVLSDVIVIERAVTLKSDLGVFTGDERVTTILAAAPPTK